MRTHNVKLADGTYELYFDNKAFYRFEEVHGSSAIKVMGSGEIGFRAITHLVWAGLLHSGGYTVDDVMGIIPVSDMEGVVGAVAKAIEDALDPKDGKKAKKKEQGQ